MPFRDAEICEFVEMVWIAALGLAVRRSDDPRMSEPDPSGLSAAVQIEGVWEGVVIVHCGAPLAARAAAIQFGVEAGAATTEEVRDALGEMANMIGGNLKSLLSGPCRLSLPAVTAGLDDDGAFMGGRLIARLAFDCQGEALQVSIRERPSAPVDAAAKGSARCAG